MKRIIIVSLLLILSRIVLFADDKKTKIYINSSAVCDSSLRSDANSKLVYWQENLANKLQDIYNCAIINTQHEVYTALEGMRREQLRGVNNDDAVTQLASNLDCTYMIHLQINVAGGTAILTAYCIDYKTTKALSRAFLTTSFSSISLANYDKVNKDLIEGLKTTEICPFKGEVKVKVTSSKKDQNRDEYLASCNNGDWYYRKITKVDNFSESDWTINKRGLRSAEGNVNFNINEESLTDETNPCYEYAPNKFKQRTYYEKITSYSSLQGLSKESESGGIKVDDARVELTFFENGTYSIRVKAASTRGVKKTLRDIKVDGVPQNDAKRPASSTNKIDAGIGEIFGPFTGNAQDRTLSQRDTFTRINPANGEEETLTFEFNLTRN